MSYDKVIKYLEYLDNGEKVRSVGFVKIEVVDYPAVAAGHSNQIRDRAEPVTERFCNVQIQVTGLHPTETCTREVRFGSQAEGQSVAEGIFGSISLEGGKGSLVRKNVPAKALCEGISYDDLSFIRVNLGRTREIVCRWREGKVELQPQPEALRRVEPQLQPEVSRRAEPQPQPEAMRRVEPQLQPEALRRVEPQLQPEAMRHAEPQPQPEAMHRVEPQLQPEALHCDEMLPRDDAQLTSSQFINEDVPKPEKMQPAPTAPISPAAPIIPPSLQENKWQQLSDIYPHISPFHDERDYLSIGPEDFVIFPKKYYSLITNSFLLHGYYNYEHLILARMVKRGNEIFYLGVPGNFYEKERQVAIMFGFESFECKTEPAQEGTYGYYMIRVEL